MHEKNGSPSYGRRVPSIYNICIIKQRVFKCIWSPVITIIGIFVITFRDQQRTTKAATGPDLLYHISVCKVERHRCPSACHEGVWGSAAVASPTFNLGSRCR
jgi:hypothetical protein